MKFRILAIALLTAVTAFAQTTPPPDLSGYWDFSVQVSAERSTKGELTLGKTGESYVGTLTPQGTNTLAVRSLTLDGKTVHMVVESREGDVTFDGTLGEDGKSMSGTVTYHKGQKFPMTAEKRSPKP